MTGRHPALPYLLLLALVVGLCGVFTLPPTDRDEARYAQATAQMLESQDFVEIRFQDGPRNKKPVGIHWLQSGAVSLVSGPDAREIWAYRLPSVLAMLIAVAATYFAGVRLLGRIAGFAGAALLAVAVIVGVEAGIAKTDSALLAATTVAMAAMASFYRGGGAGAVLVFWVAMAAGILIKGPLTPMVAGLTLFALIIIERNGRWAWRLVWPPWGPLLAIAIAAPWFVLIALATDGAFFMDAIGDDLGPKVVSAHETHGGPFGYHTLLAPLLIWPATLFVVPGLIQGFRAVGRKTWTRERDGMRFLIAWIAPSWLVFELLPTKLAHYTLPLYPALALIAGAFFAAIWERRIDPRGFFSANASLALFIIAGLVHVALVVILATVTAPSALRALTDATPGEAWSIISAAVAAAPIWLWIAAGAAAALIIVTPIALRRAPAALLAFALIAGVAWHVTALQWAAPRQVGLFVSNGVSQELRALSLHPTHSAAANPPLVATGYSEPSLVFLTHTDTVLAGSPEEAALIAAEGEARAAVVELGDEPVFLAAMRVLGAEVVRVGLVSGVNYSRGDPVNLLIYRTTRAATPEAIAEATRPRTPDELIRANPEDAALTRSEAPRPTRPRGDEG